MPDKDPAMWSRLAEFAPFILATGRQVNWNTQRFLEALIIAGATALSTMQLQAQQIEALERALSDLRAETKETVRDAQHRQERQVQALREDLRVLQQVVVQTTRGTKL